MLLPIGGLLLHSSCNVRRSCAECATAASPPLSFHQQRGVVALPAPAAAQAARSQADMLLEYMLPLTGGVVG